MLIETLFRRVDSNITCNIAQKIHYDEPKLSGRMTCVQKHKSMLFCIEFYLTYQILNNEMRPAITPRPSISSENVLEAGVTLIFSLFFI